MIGVIADPAEHGVVQEFFELFKTPWEYYHNQKEYDVLLCAGEVEPPHNAAKLILIYAGQKLSSDEKGRLEIVSQRKPARVLSHQGERIPIYGSSIAFRGGNSILVDEESHLPEIYLDRRCAKTVARIGYDLFGEVRTLLTVGQPELHAAIPALELHISLLRDLIVASGVPLVEIPPVPYGYRFVACLTHDVDHPSVRRHKFDHTMLGFLYRATLGSIINSCRGRLPAPALLQNCAAVLKLPFVYLGLAKDFWYEFDRYVELDKRQGSTFFVIPFKGSPGQAPLGPAPRRRAPAYAAGDISPKIRDLMAAGCEIGLHGIDAWLDSSAGHRELEEIRRITGTQTIGARMHWLYFNEQSPARLERAGVDYDSTMGYNGTVGYRAGTTQVYRPLQTTRLLELPLHVMDTALFFPGYLDLSAREAAERVSRIVDNAIRLGGCVTINWHDRSIAPERLWADFYAQLVSELKRRGAWFATAAQAVAWFRKRRSAAFEHLAEESGAWRVKTETGLGEDLPDLQVRVHNRQQSRQSTTVNTAEAALS